MEGERWNEKRDRHSESGKAPIFSMGGGRGGVPDFRFPDAIGATV